jgi:hypothetical protein
VSAQILTPMHGTAAVVGSSAGQGRSAETPNVNVRILNRNTVDPKLGADGPTVVITNIAVHAIKYAISGAVQKLPASAHLIRNCAAEASASATTLHAAPTDRQGPMVAQPIHFLAVLTTSDPEVAVLPNTTAHAHEPAD